MSENRRASYYQLILKVLECPNGKESQILNLQSELLDPGLLSTIIVVAKNFDESGNQDAVNFLNDLALQLGEFLGSEQQETAIREETADIFFEWGIEQYYISQSPIAFQCWQQCLIIYQAMHDRQAEAASLGNLGTAYYSQGELEKAIYFHEQSLAINQEIQDYQGEADSMISLGNIYRDMGQFDRAIDDYEKSLAICRKINNHKGVACSLIGLGNACNCLGQFENALNFYKHSLDISREIKYFQGEASALGNLGIAYQFLGEYEQAITFQEKSLAIKLEIKNRRAEANSLTNLGIAYNSLGQLEQAIAFHKKSLTISQEIKDRQGEAKSLGGLGNAYYSLGEHKRAIACYKKSLVINREIKNRSGEAASLGNLSSVYHSLGKYQQAITFHEQDLAICQEIKDRFGEATCLGNLGIAYKSLGQVERAIKFQEQSLAISREIKHRQGEANSLGNLGTAYYQLQQPEKAIEHYRDCLKITKTETTITMPPECFTAGSNLGNIGFTQGDWPLALEGYEPAIKAVEQLRKGSTTDKRRQEIIKEAFSVYANAVQCYINLKQYDKAVETADRSRSRHLADLFFASKDLYPKSEIPPEVKEYYRLQQQIYRLRSSDNDGMKGFASTPQQTPNSDAIIAKIKELEDEKKQAWLKIRSKDQVLAGQLQPDPLCFHQMQALIPDAETAILNFYTTGEHTHIFILQQNQPPQLHTCEGQGLETLQNWIFNNWLKPYVKNQTAWQNQISEFLPELTNRLQINQLISQHLNGIKELIIIPHLSLHQIPFAALPLNNTPIPQSNITSDKTRGPKPIVKPSNTPAKTPPQQPKYLSDRFRLRIVPSCQILNFCHQRGNLQPTTMGIVENATGDLVFTGYECETLATMHQVSPDNRLQYQEATVSNYETLLNKVQVLHSSHHASSQLDNSLESKLLLFDGDINLGRVFTWRFSHLAEVFLSCCETNLTLTQITDDPLSIASGFLCAGARNVVSTLWAVDDLATALFCILYYQQKQDKSRSEAIRQAQFKLRNLTGDELSASYKLQLEDYFDRQPSGEQQAEIVKNVRLRLDLLCRETLPFASPHYWAGFVSQGLA
ncbi:tetratricopeptide repeat protein [Microcoleus sp. bin38.metabat.b11b12b14.051]|uniref:CHAT domain-containing protein n=1 Tax=Microcoleus sp. bin38.metabat.b11b12b14.051 TaxID=2742709 RepID=UPI002600292A|nr:tetratricopeptide repeat protein [Microcoleus sp. bin38.metabat.b11b12b14.051]